jgi:hypothetical protein
MGLFDDLFETVLTAPERIIDTGAKLPAKAVKSIEEGLEDLGDTFFDD